MDITKMSDGAMLSGDDIDANANRERARQRRLRRKLDGCHVVKRDAGPYRRA